MNCPRCETSTLDERDREGVTLDLCRSCRGVWLDRGELEKLIARASADLDELERAPPPSYKTHGKNYRDEHEYHSKYRRKKTWIESLGDIFD